MDIQLKLEPFFYARHVQTEHAQEFRIHSPHSKKRGNWNHKHFSLDLRTIPFSFLFSLRFVTFDPA